MEAWKGAGAGEKEGAMLRISEEEEGVCLGNSLRTSQFSLSDGKKAQKERRARPFICCSRLARALVEFEFHRRCPLQMRETSGEGDRQLKPTRNGAERRETRSELLLDWTEREDLKFERRRECCAARGRLLKKLRKKKEEEEEEGGPGRELEKRKRKKEGGNGPDWAQQKKRKRIGRKGEREEKKRRNKLGKNKIKISKNIRMIVL